MEKRGFKSKFNFTIIILLIFKRLKTDCQWREPPVEIKKNESKNHLLLLQQMEQRRQVQNPKYDLVRDVLFRVDF